MAFTQAELAEFKILDKELFGKVLSEAKTKLKATFKELSKGGLKGLALGSAIGLGIGAFLNNVAKKNN